MSRRFLFIVLLFISCSIHAIAQTDYYYYQGNEIPLFLNENKVCICIPAERGDILERFLANVQTLAMIKDVALPLYIITPSEYQKLSSQDFWAEDSKHVIFTSCYFTQGNEEVYVSPHLHVELKKEEDIDILASYVELYKLMNLGQVSQQMPLWYILSVTPETEKSCLTCANELYESGHFASSSPGLVYSDGDALVYTTVRNMNTATIEESSDIYDLQGRRLTGKPTKGLYIQNGKKVMVK